MESTGLGDDVEKWLASGTDVRRLAVPAKMLTVPGLGPLLVLAVVGWPDSITMLTVEPGLAPRRSTPTSGWRCVTTSAGSTRSGTAAAEAAARSGA